MNAIHPEIESYLTRLGNELTGIPAQQRNEELRECRLHLEALIEGQREGTPGEADSIREAIHKFGSPEDIGHSLRLVHQSRPRLLLRYAMIFGVCVAVVYGLATILADDSIALLAKWWGRLGLVLILELPLFGGLLIAHAWRRKMARQSLARIRPGGPPTPQPWNFTTLLVVLLIAFSVLVGEGLTALLLLVVMGETEPRLLLTFGMNFLTGALGVAAILVQSRRPRTPELAPDGL